MPVRCGAASPLRMRGVSPVTPGWATRPQVIASVVRQQSVTALVQSELPQGWEETLDKASGKYFYWREDDPIGTRTWQRPLVDVKSVPEGKASNAKKHTQRLPRGWEESVDPATGGTYYWHVDNPEGTQTWTRPTSLSTKSTSTAAARVASRPRSASPRAVSPRTGSVPAAKRAQSPPVPHRPEKNREYRPGDTVQVWSEGFQQWVSGHVAEIAPDGAVFVHYGMSCKWVAATQTASVLSATVQRSLAAAAASALAPCGDASFVPGMPLCNPAPNYLPQRLAHHAAAQGRSLSFGCQKPLPQSAQVPQPPILRQQQKHLAGQTEDISAWLEAAREFKLNKDFDIRGVLSRDRAMSLPEVMTAMKMESHGKWTIQALADKVMLHGMLENLGVPQLPALLTLHGRRGAQEVQAEVRRFVETSLQEDMPCCILKPAHLSNGEGVLSLSSGGEEQRQNTIPHMVAHIQQYMGQKARDHESLALQTLRAGFLAQPKYQSVVGFKSPLELRVVALFGKARFGIWWWGRHGDTMSSPDACSPQRNLWVCRRQKRPGGLSEQDSWDLLHEHQGNNPGWNAAAELFRRHMPDMAATAEAVAKAFGAPFLRCDFFVGSAELGVRLNEVAYGCGLDYRGRAPTGHMTDDGPVVAQILQRGLLKCARTAPCKEFLTPLGVRGQGYEDMSVWPLPWLLRPKAAARMEASDPDAEALEVPEDLCRTFLHIQPAA